MNNLLQLPEPRWEDAVIASRICAPAAQNTPVSVTFDVGSLKSFFMYFSYLTARFEEIEKFYKTLLTSGFAGRHSTASATALPPS